MQARSRINRKPYARRLRGHLAQAMMNFVSGWDATFTSAKAFVQNFKLILLLGSAGGIFAGTSLSEAALLPIRAALATTLIHFVPIFLAVSTIGAAIYIISAARDERIRNEEEDSKIAKLDALDAQEQKLTARVQAKLKHHHAFRKALKPATQPDDQDEAVPDLSLLNNGDLLKYYLRCYLRQLGLLKVDSATFFRLADSIRARSHNKGYLPGQASVEDLIKRITGLDRNDPHFAHKLSEFLTQHSTVGVPPDFNDRVKAALGLRESFTPPPAKTKPELKGWKRWLVSVGKGLLVIYNRGNTAAGVVIWPCIVAGVFIFGSPFTWPWLAASVAFAVATGFSAYYYKKHVDKDYRKNLNEIDSQIADNENRKRLLFKLDHLSDKQHQIDKNPQDASEILSAVPLHQAPRGFNDGLNYRDLRNPYNESSPLLGVRSVYERWVPESVRNRQTVHWYVELINMHLVGMVVGIAVFSVLTALFGLSLPMTGIPLLAVTVPAGVYGLIQGIRFARLGSKAVGKANVQENAKITAVKQRQASLEEYYGTQGRRIINDEMAKSPQKLIEDLLQHFVNYSGKARKVPAMIAADAEVEEMLAKKETILELIEKNTPFSRALREDKLPNNEDPVFYEQLSLYLQSDPTTAVNADKKVAAFKKIITGKPDADVQTVGKKLSEQPTILKANDFFVRYWKPTLGAMSAAFPLGIMLFGSFALLPLAIVFATSMTFYGISRHFAGKQADMLNQVSQDTMKLNFIERNLKFVNRITPLRSTTTYGTVLRDDHPRVQPVPASTKAMLPAIATVAVRNTTPRVEIRTTSVKSSIVPARAQIDNASRYMGQPRQKDLIANKRHMSNIFIPSPSTGKPTSSLDDSVTDLPKLSERPNLGSGRPRTSTLSPYPSVADLFDLVTRSQSIKLERERQRAKSQTFTPVPDDMDGSGSSSLPAPPPIATNA